METSWLSRSAKAAEDVQDLKLPVLHLLSGLEIGGKEKVALQLARRGRGEGHDHRLLLFDTPFRSAEVDLDPRDVPWHFTQRRPGIDLTLASRILACARQHGMRLIHAHNDSAIFYGALAALLSRQSVKLIGTFHTWPSHDTATARVITRYAAKAAHCITSVSAELRARLLEHRWLNQCVTLPNGVDLAEFSARDGADDWRRRLELRDNTVLVAHVGRLDPIKRQGDLIAAAQDIALTHADIDFILVGRGPHLAALERHAHGLANLRFVAQLDDMAGFLRAADIFVLCSDHEASPLALLEAMAAGRAIIATAVGGIPDIVTDPLQGLSAVLVPPRRPDLLAAQIRELAADPARRAALGDKARRRVEAFSFDRLWDGYKRLYGAAVSTGSDLSVPPAL